MSWSNISFKYQNKKLAPTEYRHQFLPHSFSQYSGLTKEMLNEIQPIE
ncbi:hypothetical protein ACXHJ2_10785 [Paenibacillus sp. ALE3]|nr:MULTISPECIES: hypothetical protein [Paenibacillus]MCV9952400.1 hypothetical protein [Paenibacillus sp. BT-177]